jgi:hypothetical protein
MANTYNINIVGLKTQIEDGDLQDVVKEIHYRHTVTSEDGETTTSISNSVLVDAPDSDNFVEFNDLTQAEVEEWIGSEKISQERSILDENISAMITPVFSFRETPWE